eukprot:XP_001706929.1 Hypothetical protein GL50803_32738 [Giardia lamblia ATCC 50803]
MPSWWARVSATLFNKAPTCRGGSCRPLAHRLGSPLREELRNVLVPRLRSEQQGPAAVGALSRALRGGDPGHPGAVPVGACMRPSPPTRHVC